MASSTPSSDNAYRIRIVVDGTGDAGRRILRGAHRYSRSRPDWSLMPDMEPLRPKGKEWELDEGTIYASHVSPLLDNIVQRGKPIVACLAHHQHLPVSIVRTDDYAIGRMAADYFLERGFASFAFAPSGDESLAARLRYDGFSQRLAEKGFAATFIADRFGFAGLETAGLVQRILALRRPLALMVCHDGVASAATELLTHAHLAIPEHVAVLGVDNDEFHCQFSSPVLSSIDIPYEELGYQAAAMLQRLLAGKPAPAEPELVQPSGVITRASTDIVAFDEPRLSEALRYIREHACTPCSVDDVLDKVVVSRRWLEGQFQARFKRTPHQEIIRVRMERAKHLLTDPSIPLKTVAERCGYPHVQNFVGAFRVAVGQTPAVYRRELRPKAPQLA